MAIGYGLKDSTEEETLQIDVATLCRWEKQLRFGPQKIPFCSR